MKFSKYFVLLILSTSLVSQEGEEIPIEEIRDNKIKALLEIIKENKDIYVSEDSCNTWQNLERELGEIRSAILVPSD